MGTLVTAGIYLLIRINLIIIEINITYILLLIGIMTIIIAGITAIIEIDIKKNYCVINFKSTWYYNINFRHRKSYIIFFSFIISCFFQGNTFYMCRDNYS